MNLEAGSRLGAYEILSLLGAGGMGEVYRARDTRLDRTVAIKILQGHLALNPEIRQRFEREARVVSSLNHPNICTLYDVGHLDGMDYLVMEHLEGESLADRLTRGPVPLPELLRIGMQVSDALDRAHRQGLIHRDLKPGNIMLTPGGAKLLDFGLARATGLAGSGGSGLSSPTMSRPITVEGTIVGTYQYMAPEVLEGKEADARSDIFSFGAVLYEMATGHRAFEGKSQASLIAAIMRETPRPISSFDAVAPPALDRTVQRCLEKEPDDRYQTARDVLLELKWVAEAGSRAGVAAPVAARRKSRERLAWGLAGIALVAALTFAGILMMRSSQKPEPLQFFIDTPRQLRSVGTPKISPDGRYLAFNGVDSTGVPRLWLRPLGSLAIQALPGTENAARPFWSPDSRYLAYMAGGKLRKVSVTGGPPQVLSDGTAGDGTWGSRGLILFDGSPNDSIRGTNAAGGDVVPITRLDRSRGETGNAWPQFLPDGRHFLYLALAAKQDQTSLYVGDTKSAKKVLVSQGNISRIEYADPGYILFVRDGALLAQPFDPKRFRKTGEPFPIADDVAAGGGVASNADFSASRNGILVFRGGLGSRSRLTWVDRSGRVLERVGEAGAFASHALSPDGSRVAVETEGTGQGIWVIDAKRGVTSRFTLGSGNAFWPVWSPDGRSIAFTSSKNGGKFEIFLRTAVGAPSESLLTPPEVDLGPADWSRDGRYLAAMAQVADGGWDLWMLPMNPRGPAVPIVATPAAEMEPRISPDSRWLAYSSNESGRREVYVQAFPGPGGKWQVSSQGGRDPVWRADGKELFFLSPGGALMSVDVAGTASMDLGVPKVLFVGLQVPNNPVGHSFAVSEDGKRFLIRTADAAEGLPATTVFVHWRAGLARP